jgi:hypothetical protein
VPPSNNAVRISPDKLVLSASARFLSAASSTEENLSEKMIPPFFFTLAGVGLVVQPSIFPRFLLNEARRDFSFFCFRIRLTTLEACAPSSLNVGFDFRLAARPSRYRPPDSGFGRPQENHRPEALVVVGANHLVGAGSIGAIRKELRQVVLYLIGDPEV